MPALFFIWIFLQQIWLEKQTFFIGLFPLAFVFCFWYMPFRNLWHTKKMMKNRHSPGNEWHQPAFKTADEFISSANEIKKIIPDKSRVCIAFDPTPNTALYLLEKRGVRISPDFEPKMTAEIIANSKSEYLVLNDTLLWFKHYQPFIQQKISPIYNNGINLFVYRLEKNVRESVRRP